jgi:ribosomal protein S18 acetylase RimI-like enzyme
MEIIPLSEEHIDSLIPLGNNLFGEGYMNAEYLADYINSTNKICLTAWVKSELAGYIMLETGQANSINKILLKDSPWFLEVLNKNDAVGFIQQIGVSPDHQEKGLGRKLVKFGLDHPNYNAQATCCVAWKKGKVTPLNKLLTENNFKLKKSITNYWQEDSIEKGYSCQYCGQPPCSCTAEIFIKKRC